MARKQFAKLSASKKLYFIEDLLLTTEEVNKTRIYDLIHQTRKDVEELEIEMNEDDTANTYKTIGSVVADLRQAADELEGLI